MASRFFRSRRRKTFRRNKKEEQPFFKKVNDAPMTSTSSAFFTPQSMPIQTKLEVGPVDDPYEREADEMGEKAAKAGGDTTAFVASRYNYSFKNVKLHTGQKSQQMNRALRSQAFTQGNDIHFNKGKYQPETKAGKKLLAHELTHVVQQGRGAAPSIQRQDDPAPEVAPGPQPPAPGEAMSRAYFIKELKDRYGVADVHTGTKEEQNARHDLHNQSAVVGIP